VIYTEDWRPPWRTPLIACCRGPECRSLPPHRMIASTLVDGLCRECRERRGGVVPEQHEAEQLGLGFDA
jgi:hypothetical protein